MKKGIGFVVVGILCALVGGGAEYARNQFVVIPALIARIAEQDNQADKDTPRVVRVVDESAQNEVVLLKKRIEDLEAQLQGGVVASLPPQPESMDAPAPVQAENDRRSSRTNQTARGRFQMTPEQREERRQVMEQSMAEHYSFLENIDQKNMDQAQRENHARLLEKVAQMNELRNALAASTERPSPETFQLLRSTSEELRDLYSVERQYMLQSLGRSTGMSSDQSSAFAEQVQQVYQNTTMPHLFGGGGHRDH